MTSVFRDVMHSLRASPVFALYVLVALGLAGIFGLMVVIMQLQPGFMGMAHFTDPSHRTHEVTYAFLVGVAVIGLLAQLRRPAENVAGMLMALTPSAALLLAAILSADAGVILSTERMLIAVGTVMAAVLHPTGRGFFRSFRVSRVNWLMLALLLVAAVPLLSFALSNVGLQATTLDDHARAAHYGFMAAFGFTVIGLGLLASLRLAGWWLPAWTAGGLPVLLGLTSLVYPDNSSSLDLVWALAAIGWGVAFAAAAELTQSAENPTLLGSLRTAPRADTRVHPHTPRWATWFGIVALFPIVLFFTLPLLAGGLPGGHAPGQGGPVQQGPGSDSASDHEGNTPPVDGAPELAVTADELTFTPARIELSPAQPVVNIALTSVDALHDLTIDEIDFHLAADGGETATGGLTGRAFGEPGTYIGYCSVPGHREAGMEFVIVVEAPDGFGH